MASIPVSIVRTPVYALCNTFRHSFNPIFVLPVCEAGSTPPLSPRPPTPTTHTPGRRTGTGSANIQFSARVVTPRVPITGFREVSLLSMLRLTGQVPPFNASPSGSYPRSLENIRSNASQPLVVFPECTTSNGRGMLRFADVFKQNIPVKNYQVFIMCVR